MGTDGAPRGRLRLLRWGVVALTAFVALWFLLPQLGGGLRDGLGQGDYVLEATDGGRFSAGSLQGHPSAVFFGFTHCPEVCPTTLGEIGTWQDMLGPEAEDLHFWFVTVDPERDNVALLRDYVSWTPGVVGVSGTPAEVEKAMTAFKVFARRVPLSDGGYTMDHSPYVMLFDRQGRFDQVIAYQEPTDSAVAKLRRLLSLG